MVKDEFYVLRNNIKIPKVGFGTWQVNDGEECYKSVLWALEAGYTHIDTAAVYENEESVGKAIKDSKIDRNKLFITTKLPASIKTYEGTKEAFFQSLKKLDLDYIDLYLIHAPWPWQDLGGDYHGGNILAWKAMIELYNEGLIKSIGVSNFKPQDIMYIVEATNFIPMVNQIRFFIGNTQEDTITYCIENNILVEAYSPLATGEIVNNPILKEIADKYKVSIPKLCLRYCIDRGTLPLPKSIHQERIIDNLDLDFVIDETDMNYLNELKGLGKIKPLR